MSWQEIFRRWFVTKPPRLRCWSKSLIPTSVQWLEPRTLLSGIPSQLTDPHPQDGNRFGENVTVLINGNVVVTSPNDDAGGGSTANGTGAGAVYLFNGETGALIKTLNGSHDGDQIGSGGLIALANGNFVIQSPGWNDDRGAVTFASGETGVSGFVNAANSLVGSRPGDDVGAGGVTSLSSGNYVVISSFWANGSALNAGAITWGSGTTGVAGTISKANSLVGTTANDQVGFRGVVALTNGNYVVDSDHWNNGLILNAGAVTWANGTVGVKGNISATNSLIGKTANDNVGLSGITKLTNGNYVVGSDHWNSDVTQDAGAVTWGNGTTGVKGVVDAANSLIGSHANDEVGLGGVTVLTNGNYVVDSSHWTNGALKFAGAVTWGSGSMGVMGAVSPANSFVGTNQHDFVGRGGVTALTNGNYVVDSYYWRSPSASSAGAVTWGNGASGLRGTISSANSLIGSSDFDEIGYNGITALTNGNFVVDSPYWDSGTIVDVGAVTWGNGGIGVKGFVSSTNSLVGSTENDSVGGTSVTALTNGNYIVDSAKWNSADATDTGAVTWCDGLKGGKGLVSAINSLIGSLDGDEVGGDGVTALTTGNYVIDSYKWGPSFEGAVTWGSGITGVKGEISSSNSLVGSHPYDEVGRNGVKALANGNYVVSSELWSNGIAADVGASTFGKGSTGITGTVSAANSLVGTTANDRVGNKGIVVLNDGNYVVKSSLWFGGLGAATFSPGTKGVTGIVSNRNSLVGQRPNPTSDATVVVTSDDAHGAVYVTFAGDGSGEVYRGSTTTGFNIVLKKGPAIRVSDDLGPLFNRSGTLDFGYTILGTPSVQIVTVTNSGTTPLVVQPVSAPEGFSVTNNFSPDQSIAAGASASFSIELSAARTGTPNGAITIRTNVANALNYTFRVQGIVADPKDVPSKFIDPHPRVGNEFGATVTPLTNGNVVITSPNDDAGGGSTDVQTGAGAVYLYNGQTGVLISTITGSHAGDQLGSDGVVALADGNFVVDSSSWNDNEGAVTWGSQTKGVSGKVSAANSLVGSTADDQVGYGHITPLSNGNYVVDSYFWGVNTVGAVTWGDGQTGISGVVSSANSLIGSTADDQVGNKGVTALTNGNYVVDSDSWGSQFMGAVTWGDGTKGISGIVSSANSLVGSAQDDGVGNLGVTALSNGNYVVDSDQWGSKAFGAVTWGDGTKGITGSVSRLNSLVGELANDGVGSDGVTALTNGNYVVDSANWNNGSIVDAGAVTWSDGTIGLTGVVGPQNSLVGTTANDEVGDPTGAVTADGRPGFSGVTALANGNYVVNSALWHNGSLVNAGAVTWGRGTMGIRGPVSSANSLVGTNTGDQIGDHRTVPLSNGNYVVSSPFWGGGGIADRGAVTWGNGTSGIQGAISSANSLVGSTAQDKVGFGGVTALTNGNYVVDSYSWDKAGFGAVTWGNGTTGIAGPISATNSLIGSSAGDKVGYGGVTALSNGSYVVDSWSWNNGTATQAGAVTFGSGTKGVHGIVGLNNSLVGSIASDKVGNLGVTALSNGNYVVDSDVWGKEFYGAVTWGSGKSGVSGPVSSSNSLVGNTASDRLGSQGVTSLSNGNYVVKSSSLANYRGGVSFGRGDTAVSGTNTIVGTFAGDGVATLVVAKDEVHGTIYAAFPDSGSGLVYRGLAATGFLNLTDNGPSINVSDNGTALTNGVSVVSFGSLTLGTLATQTITVTNYGNSPLIVHSVSVSSGFKLLNGFTTSQSIASGASASFILQLTASQTGAVNGTVTLQTNVPNATSFTFQVTGALAAPAMQVSQVSAPLVNGEDTVNMRTTQVGTASSQVITVTNKGDAPLFLTSINLPVGFSVVSGIDFNAGQTIAKGASASFVLQLDAMETGTFSGVVTISDNDAENNPFSFLVMGTVTAPRIIVQQGATTLVSNSSSIDFGSTPAGTPITQVISVTNDGSAPLIVQPAQASAGFSIVDGANFTANQSIAVGASAEFTVQLDAGTAGISSGRVTVRSSDSTASPFTFRVTGFAKPTRSTPILVVQQETTVLSDAANPVEFNSGPRGTAVSQTITVKNEGNADLIVQPLAVPAGFSLLSNFHPNQSILPGGSANVTIQLNAGVQGTPTGRVTISTNDPVIPKFTFTVVANHRPTAITLNPFIAQTNLTDMVVVGSLTSSDPDPVQSFTYQVNSPTFVNGTTALPVFALDSNGNLDLSVAAPVGVYYSVPITSTDQGGLSLTQQLTIYITSTSTDGLPSSITIANGTKSNVTISNLPLKTVQVQDAQGDQGQSSSSSALPSVRFSASLTSDSTTSGTGISTRQINLVRYQLADGGDNLYFTIDANGHLQTSTTLTTSLKTVYHLTIISTDTLTGVSTLHPCTVTLIPLLKDAIPVKSATFLLPEGSLNGTVLGTVSATDNDGFKPTFAITGGNINNAFAIDRATGRIIVANSTALSLVYNPTFRLTVQATDSKASGAATITINLARIKLSNTFVAANAHIGAVIGQFSTLEARTGNSYRYSLVPNKLNDNAFTIDASGNLKLNVGLNVSVKSSYLIDVISTDQHGMTVEKRFAITVIGPSSLTLSNSSVTRTAAIGTIIGKFNTIDAGTGNTFHYSLPLGIANNTAFTVDAEGNLRLNLRLTSTLRRSLTVNVVSTDEHGLKISKQFTISISRTRVL